MPEIEKAVRWYMKEIMKNTTDEEPVDGLVLIFNKGFATEDGILGAISFFKTEPSVETCREFSIKLKKEIEKELQNPHTYLITARLVEALTNLQMRGEIETENYSLKVEICYDILRNRSYEDSVEETFKIFSKMDRL